jgi:hypothetical protein
MKKFTLLVILMVGMTGATTVASPFKLPFKLPFTVSTTKPSPKVVSTYDDANRAKIIGWTEQLKEMIRQAALKLDDVQHNLEASEQLRIDAEKNLILLDGQIKVLATERDNLITENKNLMDQVAVEKENVKKEHLIAHRNALERDIFIYAFAAIGTILALTLLRPVFAMLPPQFTLYVWAIYPASAIAIFYGIYGLIRLGLAMFISKL